MLDAIASIVVSLSQQKLFAYDTYNRLVYAAPVSTGRQGYVTPTGQFSIGSKYARTDLVGKDYRVNLPYVQCLEGAGLAPEMYCLHPNPYPEQELGKPHSRGCVRTSTAAARWLFDRTTIGTAITIIE